MTIRKIEEYILPNKRLGRHIEHDPRSKNYVARQLFIGVLRPIKHRRWGHVFDQGSLGSCTGNAAAGILDTDPLHTKGHILHEPDAVALYELATTLDSFPGAYPPDDTGSTGLAVAKAAKAKGLITGYGHAFGIDQALKALQLSPLITGVNWYEGFDTPDTSGLVTLEGQIRGGHEFEVCEYLPGNPDRVGCYNSWGTSWGVKGKFYMTVNDWAILLEQEGDVTVFYR